MQNQNDVGFILISGRVILKINLNRIIWNKSTVEIINEFFVAYNL